MPNWRSWRARAALRALRPLDRQLARITYFEHNFLQQSPPYYDAGKPLTWKQCQQWAKRFAEAVGIDTPPLRHTTALHAYTVVMGARPAIHLNKSHQHPYYVAHEIAHCATHTLALTQVKKHPPAWVQKYLDCLALVTDQRGVLERTMRDTYRIQV